MKPIENMTEDRARELLRHADLCRQAGFPASLPWRELEALARFWIEAHPEVRDRGVER